MSCSDNIKLGVFYTCYKERTAVEESIKELRKYYKNAPLYLISDGGLDFSYLEPILNIKTTIASEGMGYSKNMEKVIASGNINWEQLVKESYTFLDRINQAIIYCKTQDMHVTHLLIMEPDVWVRGKLTIDINTDLTGPTPNKIPLNILEMIRINGGNTKVTHFGASAGILKISSFLKVYALIKKNELALRVLLQADPALTNYDYLLTVLFAFYGFNYVENPELTECIRNPYWEHTNHPLLHQHRKYYGQNEGKHG
jgi:hypothetical protein